MVAGSSVGVATGYGLDGQEIVIRFPGGTRDFSLLRNVQTNSETTQRPINGDQGVFSCG
jgi:hypothetical protein